MTCCTASASSAEYACAASRRAQRVRGEQLLQALAVVGKFLSFQVPGTLGDNDRAVGDALQVAVHLEDRRQQAQAVIWGILLQVDCLARRRDQAGAPRFVQEQGGSALLAQRAAPSDELVSAAQQALSQLIDEREQSASRVHSDTAAIARVMLMILVALSAVIPLSGADAQKLLLLRKEIGIPCI